MQGLDCLILLIDPYQGLGSTGASGTRKPFSDIHLSLRNFDLEKNQFQWKLPGNHIEKT